MHDRHYYRVLTRKIAGTMILVSLMPLALVSATLWYRFEKAYRSEVMARVEELVRKHTQGVDSFLGEKLSCISTLANSFTYAQLADERFLDHQLKTLQQAYRGEFVDLSVVNADGRQVSYAGSYKLEHADYSGANWFLTARDRPLFISDVFTGFRGEPHFIISCRRYSESGMYIVRATIDFNRFNILVKMIKFGETGTAFIINRNGEFQTRVESDEEPALEFATKLRTGSTGLKYSSGRQGQSWFPAPSAVDPSDSSAGEERVLTGLAVFGGRHFIYAVSSLKGGDWTLVFRQQERDALRELYALRGIIIFVIAFGAAAVFMTSSVLSRKLVAQLERLDRERELMNERVVESGKLAAIGELATGVAHEINNPLAIMIEEAGWMEDLLDDTPGIGEDVPEFRRALRQIRSQGKRCREITHKLLSFARTTDPRAREVDVNELAAEAIELCAGRSSNDDVKIAGRFAEELPVIHAAPAEFQQVLINIINNAVDSLGSAGGRVDVMTRAEGRRVVIEVRDTGEGIPQELIGRIFDPFFTTRPVGRGTGLGLSICYGIVRKIGGEIRVESVVGQGTTFNILIPAGELSAKVES